MGSLPQLELDNQLCFALYDASRALIRAYGPLLDELRLTYPQYVTMLVLWETDGPMTVGELSNRLHLDSGTLTPLLKRLEQLGLVTRQRDIADERRVLVRLTESGTETKKAAADIPKRLQERLNLDVDSARRLHRQLIELIGVLNEAHEEPRTRTTEVAAATSSSVPV